MTIGPEMNLRDLAFTVCTALSREGVTAVLTGGGAATVYAPEACQSHDLDFILQFSATTFAPPARPLELLGFTRRGGAYVHSATPFMVEFPAGPLAVGSEQLTEWDTMADGDELLHILNPTDCVRDRLAWFLFNSDYSCLEQALAVARTQPVDVGVVERWCVAEGEREKFAVFRHRLSVV